MSDSLCDAVDIYLTAVHNMHVRILPDPGIFWVEAGHEACDAWYRTHRCRTPAHRGVHVDWRLEWRVGSVDGRDRPHYLRHRQGHPRLAAGRDHRMEPASSQPEGHPAAAASGSQRPAGPAGREPPGQERRV